MQDAKFFCQPHGIFYLDAPSASICLLIQLEKPATEEGGVTPSVYSRKDPDPKRKVHKPVKGVLRLEIEKHQTSLMNLENTSESGSVTNDYADQGDRLADPTLTKSHSNGSDGPQSSSSKWKFLDGKNNSKNELNAHGNIEFSADDFEAFDFRTTMRNGPFLQLFHCLCVYPLTVNLSRKRNLFIRVELRKDDADIRRQPLEAMCSREPDTALQMHHLLFTFFHIDLQTRLEAPKPVVIGYASLPLSTHAQFRSEISLPIMRELVPHYLQDTGKERLDYLEDGKNVFRLRLRLCSYLYPANERIRDFFS